MEAMSKMSSTSCGPEIEEKRVTSIFCEDDFRTQEVRKEDRVKSAKAEMGEVKEENERLKMMLERVEKDYHSLQLRFFDILHKDVSKKGVAADSSTTSHDETEEPAELVSLCLGRSPKESNKKEEARTGDSSNKPKEKVEDMEVNLTLGLDSKYLLSMELVPDLSPMNSSELEQKEAEPEGTTTLSTNKSAKVINVNDESSDQMPAKRARVSVRAKCETPTMNDGCQWRKYGQKIAKGNPCPRAYYRCTVAPACPVRKQVQRCAEDLSILITTYEGTHNHPLQVSATAMASVTSAAASMMLSGSSTSQHYAGHHSSASFGTNSPTVLNGLSFSQQYDQEYSRAKQLFLPPPNHASHLFPTVTLDLTSSASFSTSQTHVHNNLPSNIASSTRFSPTSLSFCSPEPNFTPSIWAKGFPTKTQTRPIIQGNHFQEHLQCMMTNQTPPSREALAETITKAISTDPSLRSVIAAAVSSIVGTGSTSGDQAHEEIRENNNILGPGGLNLRLGEHIPQLVSSSNQNGKGQCLTGYFKRLSPTSSQARNFMLLQPSSLPFSLSKSSTSKPPSFVNHINHYDPDMNTHH